MNAEKVFKRWMVMLTILFVAVFGYVVVADRYAPITTEGRVQSFVVPIAPEVTGVVRAVHVVNNQRVKKGDLLLSIDRRKFDLAHQEARLSLRLAQDRARTLQLDMQAVKARINRAYANLDNSQQELTRVEALYNKKLVAKAVLDDAYTQVNVFAADLDAEEQNLHAIEAELGITEGRSTQVSRALNLIAQAELDLENLDIVAPNDGIVTNLQIQPGITATINMPLLTFVSTQDMWVSADFREKSLINLAPDSIALVAFDAIPGQVFEFDFASQDFGVASVQQRPDGSLTQVELNNRWVRDAQRSRVHFNPEGKVPEQLFVGSRATVTFYPQDNAFWSTIANLQIQAVSWLHFIY